MTKYKIHLSPPHMSGREMQYIQNAFDENWIAPAGPNIERFEEGLENFTGSQCAVALSSGTAAIHLALLTLGIGKGDLVLCQSLTFVASANPILYAGAEPVFIDSEPTTWNICPNALESAILHYEKIGRKPKALIVVHLYGNPAHIRDILAICGQHNIPLIEDAAEALGSTYDDQQAGTFGEIGILSFNGNKIITTSAGGALLTDNQAAAEKALYLATQAKQNAPFYQHLEVGYNYRMSNICAGIGCGQLEVIEERVKQRRQVFEWYQTHLNSPEIAFQQELPNALSNRWLTAILLENNQAVPLRQYLDSKSIESRRIWKPMHLQPLFKNAPYFGNNVAATIFENGLCLPSGSALLESEVEEISTHITDFLKNKNATRN